MQSNVSTNQGLNLIPKVINYCWFGGADKPDCIKKCIESWSRLCPDYKIVEWNEDNFDIGFCKYCKEAYESHMWAFVSDVARLKIIHDYGGIYLDTDVELIKNLDELCCLEAYAGFQDDRLVATGLGFGATKGHPVINFLLDGYIDRAFVLENGAFDRTPCPEVDTRLMIELGLKQDGSRQELEGMTILPSDYLCPINFETGELTLTDHTVSIHHFDGTWYGPIEKIKRAVKGVIPLPLLKWLRSNVMK